jgi:type IV secretory pathway TrbF-like protein
MDNSVYLRAPKEWDDRYGDLVLGKRNWQIGAGGLWQLRLSGRLKVMVAIGPSRSTRKFSAMDVALLRADAPMQLAHPPSGLRANHRC